ncbi:response regulator [Sphingomonas quercus]|uniref:Response regulator n=1 Tax=Sphingomonas quercus TaxID=2842451 RepID=A0ABS6BMW4_9SPHN|nr:response regulator [Sphingomonas quercus]MBU3079197.1 response regulator [Sphingomonas quercus]
MRSHYDYANVSGLEGLRVLVVEDEPMVAMTLEDALAEFGCKLVAVAETVAEALAAVEQAPAIDVAVLDVNLGGEKVFPVADALGARGVPFAFSTGYGPADLTQRYPGSGLLNKPYPPLALARTLTELAQQR